MPTSQTLATEIWPPVFREANHPLAGKLWSIDTGQFIESEQLFESLSPDTWLLLGESHENPDHHLAETQLIRYLAIQSRLGTVAFEMANTDQQEALDIYLGADRKEISAQSLGWERGWDWNFYAETVTTALAQADRVIATDLTRDAKLAAYEAPDLHPAPSDEYEQFMLDLLFESHCGHLPKSQLGNMLAVQIARDIQMAQSLKANTSNKIDLMIVGGAHTRYDIGIPLIASNWKSISVLMVALNDNTSPESYVPESYSSSPSVDYLLFTPERTYQDMCDRIPKQ